jgi:hypothetical protein
LFRDCLGRPNSAEARVADRPVCCMMATDSADLAVDPPHIFYDVRKNICLLYIMANRKTSKHLGKRSRKNRRPSGGTRRRRYGGQKTALQCQEDCKGGLFGMARSSALIEKCKSGCFANPETTYSGVSAQQGQPQGSMFSSFGLPKLPNPFASSAPPQPATNAAPVNTPPPSQLGGTSFSKIVSDGLGKFSSNSKTMGGAAPVGRRVGGTASVGRIGPAADETVVNLS